MASRSLEHFVRYSECNLDTEKFVKEFFKRPSEMSREFYDITVNNKVGCSNKVIMNSFMPRMDLAFN